MTYLQLAYLHLATVLPAFLIGTLLLLVQKGTGHHKLAGKVYMVLMMTTAFITLFMKAEIGPLLLDHFGLIHGFSLLVLFLVPRAFFAVRAGQMRRHKLSMIGVYAGGILTAGIFAFMPGRLLHVWIFGTV